jgi:sugar/nucleoside kinase (ribokinase family)
MMNKRNDFICIGAVHSDYILKFKQNYYKNRTNPIIQEENLGGVAYNIAKKLSFLNQETTLYSLNCNEVQKKEIKLQGIKFKTLNKQIAQRYYTSILDRNGKMILGLANMDDYEQFIAYKNLKNFKNKNIILDLNLSAELIKEIIDNNYKKNNICICGTSSHKIYKIKRLLKKIDTIILNKQEATNLTKKETIKDSMDHIIKQNKNLDIIITNGKNSVNVYINKINFLIYPPIIKIKNENGAGDALIAIFNYFYCDSFDKFDAINMGICGGALQASGYIGNKEKYLLKLKKLSRSLKSKIIK